MAQAAAQQTAGTGRYVINTSTLTPEGWTAIIVLFCLGLLIAIRMGFRGVDVLGASVRVG